MTILSTISLVPVCTCTLYRTRISLSWCRSIIFLTVPETSPLYAREFHFSADPLQIITIRLSPGAIVSGLL